MINSQIQPFNKVTWRNAKYELPPPGKRVLVIYELKQNNKIITDVNVPISDFGKLAYPEATLICWAELDLYA